MIKNYSPIKTMGELHTPRLTKRSIALDDFQLININLQLMKNEKPSEASISSSSSANKKSISSLRRSSITVPSRPELRQGRSSKKWNVTSEDDSLGFSRTEDMLNQKENTSSHEMYEAKAVQYLDETILKVIELNNLDFVQIDDRKSKSRIPESKIFNVDDIDRRDVCRESTCMDSKFRLPPIHRTASQNIAWDMKGLSDEPGPKEGMSLHLQKVDMRRKEKHDYIVKEIDLRMNDLNDVVEREIRKEAENLVSNIQLIKESVEQILDQMREKPSPSLNNKLILRMQEIIQQLNDSRLTKIESFCGFVRKLEKHRSDRFKLILKNAYKDMHNNMYLMPFEIQMFFEKKVQHLNQVTMNNYHCYTELGYKLKIQMEEEMRLWFQAIKYHESITIAVEKTEESPPKSSPDSSIDTAVRGETKEEILKKLKKADEEFRHLKKISTNLKFLQCNPTLEVFEDFLDEMKNAADALFSAGFVGQNGLNIDLKSEMGLSMMHLVGEDELQKMWYDGIEEMLSTLNNNLKSFSNSTRIFDCYFDRMEELKYLYLAQQFLLMTKNDKQTAKVNNNMNLLIDALRQDVSEDSLNNTFQQIQDTVFNIDCLIQMHLGEETALVDKYLDLGKVNVDILLDELRRFVKQFIPPPDSDPRKMKKRASWMTEEELKTNDHLFSKDFLHCRYLMQGVDNWQFGVWHALTTIADTSKQIITTVLNEWAHEEKKKLLKRSELKSTINNVRIQNIKEDFWKLRLAELKVHEERINLHEMAVRHKLAELSRLKSEIVEYSEKCKIEYDEGINKIMSNCIVIKKEKEAMTIIKNLRVTNTEITSNFKELYEKLRNECFTIMNNIRISHIKFMKSIKLFSEDGNFSSGEAKSAIKKITALEKIMQKELSNSKVMINTIQETFITSCASKLDVPLINMLKTVKEFSFKGEIETKLKKLQREIAENIFEISYEIKALYGKMKSFYEASYKKENLGDYDFLTSFTRCFKEIISNISDMGQILQYEDTLALNEKWFKQKIDTSQVSLMSSVASKGGKSIQELKTNIDNKSDIIKEKKVEKRKQNKVTGSSPKSKNYVTMLYPTAPYDNGKFFSNLHYKIYTSFCDVQEVSKIFYETHGDILDRDRLPSDYKFFMAEILLKYKFHQLQVEFTWLDIAIEFRELLGYFKKFLENVYKDSLRKYFEERSEMMNLKCEEVLQALEQNLKEVETNYMSIHNELKPMYGHPENEYILSEVSSYIDSAEQFNRTKLLDRLEPCRESIKQHCVTTETLFLDMEKILSCIKNDSSLPTIDTEYESKLVQRIDILHQMLSGQDYDLNVANQTDFDIDLKTKLQGYKYKVFIPSDCLISYSDTLLNISAVESSPDLDMQMMIEDNLNMYKKTAQKINNLNTKCAAVDNKFKVIWAQDIEKIKNLYKIKYDAPPSE